MHIKAGIADGTDVWMATVLEKGIAWGEGGTAIGLCLMCLYCKSSGISKRIYLVR